MAIGIKISNTIIRLNIMVVEKKFIEKKESKNIEGDAQMAFFEFKNGKIFKIFESGKI